MSKGIELSVHEAHPAYEAALFLNKKLESFQEMPVLLLVSGRSSYAIVDDLNLSLMEDVTVGLVDERMSDDPAARNMTSLLKSEFHDFATLGGMKFLNIRQGNPQTSAQAYETSLRKWMADYPEHQVFVILGIGEDGHTAGIMPFPKETKKFNELFNGEKWVAGYDADQKNLFRLRVTVTNTFLKRADVVLAYAVGPSKREALKKVLAPTGNVAQTPARILHELPGEVILFTDQSIAGRLGV